MNEGERTIKIERLLTELSEATAQKTALLGEVQELAAGIPEIRAAFGNPFFYSHPEHSNESIANYTDTSSHDVVLPTILALGRIDRELGRIKEQLLGFGIDAD